MHMQDFKSFSNFRTWVDLNMIIMGKIFRETFNIITQFKQLTFSLLCFSKKSRNDHFLTLCIAMLLSCYFRREYPSADLEAAACAVKSLQLECIVITEIPY